MAVSAVADTGPIVAWLNAADAGHEWAKAQFERLRPPVLTCEPVLAEAAHLVRRGGGRPASVVALVEKGILRVALSVQEQAPHLVRLMGRYENLQMSLADACLVRLSELVDDAVLMTFDAEFLIYRRHRRLLIPLMAPERLRAR